MENSRITDLQKFDLNNYKPNNFINGSQSGSQIANGLSPVDSVNIDMTEVYKSLTVLGDTIVKKLDEILKKEVPGGVSSLDPKQHTPEATAQRIVDGVTNLFNSFSKQFLAKNPGTENNEVNSNFMSIVRQGIMKGYSQAATVLGDLGALDIDGIKLGIEETMRLVEEKLTAFEKSLDEKSEVGVETPVEDNSVKGPSSDKPEVLE